MKLSNDELRDYKLKTACTRFGKFSHRAVDHHIDGSVCHVLPSNDAPPRGAAQMRYHTYKPSPAKALDKASSDAALEFNTISTSSHSANVNAVSSPSIHKTRSDNDLGPKADGGAPYSAIGIVGLSLVSPSMTQTSSKTCDPIPVKVSH